MEEQEERAECSQCGLPIHRYCHSQAGSLRAYAWSSVEWDDEDPRDGVYCEQHGDYPWVHVPEEQDR